MIKNGCTFINSTTTEQINRITNQYNNKNKPEQ